MDIFKCKIDGTISTSNQSGCPICDRKEWERIDPASMTERDWETALDSVMSKEDEFLLTEEWAKTGDAAGIKVLAERYLTGLGCEKDERRSVELLESLMDKRDPEVYTLLGPCYLFGTGVEKDIMKGLELLWKARDMKDGDAAFMLGNLYEHGMFVPQDMKKAKKLYKQAAECGSEFGMFAYGNILFDNLKTEKDVYTAYYWLWRAASEDLGDAQLGLGILLNNSALPIYDEDQALYWLYRAAENECDEAATAFTEAYLRSTAALEDGFIGLDEIILMLKKALDRGDCLAAKTLGDFSLDGVAGDPNPVRAYQYYRMGQGRCKACTAAVAHCYHYGIGVEKNANLAFLMLTDLIDVKSGSITTDVPSSAVIELGDMYRDGEGTVANPNYAALLYLHANSRKDPCAQGRLARELLAGNPYITLKEKVSNPIILLKKASGKGDFDSALFLAKHFLAVGDRDQAVSYMEEALYLEDNYHGGCGTRFAEEHFPELLTVDNDLAGRAELDPLEKIESASQT